MCLCTHKLLLTLVTCCNFRAVFICVGGLIVVVALAFISTKRNESNYAQFFLCVAMIFFRGFEAKMYF